MGLLCTREKWYPAKEGVSPGAMTTAEQRLLNPKPGGAIARARDFGIDLTLLIGRLRLTPEERLEDLQRFMLDMEAIRGAAQRANDTSSKDPASAVR